MKRLLIPLIVVALCAATATRASADERFAHTCNQSGAYEGVTGLGIAFLGNVNGHAKIVESFDYQCGHGGTIEWDLQGMVNGVWTDEANSHGASIDHQVRNTRASGVERFFHNTSHTLRPCTGRHGRYRVVVYDAGVQMITSDFSENCE